MSKPLGSEQKSDKVSKYRSKVSKSKVKVGKSLGGCPRSEVLERIQHFSTKSDILL